MTEQRKKIKNIINYAIENTDYYRKTVDFKYDYKDLKILEKKDLRINKFSILSNEHKIIDKFKNLNNIRTSGSTGEITEVFWDNNDLLKSNYTLWKLRYKWYGIKATDKYVSFSRQIYFGTRIKKPQKIQIFNNNIVFSKFHLTEEDIVEYVEKMKEFNPKWMLIQPSIIIMIMNVLKNKRIKLPSSIVYIELNGEYVSKTVEQKIKDFFNVSVANMYGAYEVNTIAYECPYGNMHVLEENVYVTEENGDCLVTSLHNYAMPIIKYSVGDKVKLENIKCSCGLTGICINMFHGRSTDYLIINNQKHSPYFIVFSIEEINMLLDSPITQFKIVQKENAKISIYLKVDDSYSGWNKTIKNELLFSLNNNSPINDLRYEIIISKDLNNLSGNKYKFFERTYKNE